MATMNAPWADLLAIAHVGEGHLGVGATHGLGKREPAAMEPGTSRPVDQLEFLDMPRKAILEDLNGNMRTIAVDAADGVVAVGKAAASPAHRGEIVTAEKLARRIVGAAEQEIAMAGAVGGGGGVIPARPHRAHHSIGDTAT